MTKLTFQSPEYLDSNLTKVFHFLELSSNHAVLIGSSRIRNILYNNDYDLNENLNIDDTIQVLNKLHQEFIDIFRRAYSNEQYYIIDFKCGYIKNEAIRWTFNDLKRGYITNGSKKITFQECLLMPDNITKLDLVYILNGLFTDINILYNLHIVNDKKDLPKEKELNVNNVKSSIKEDIQDLVKEKKYFKVMKRSFALSVINKNMDQKLLELFNSDYGRFYKVISMLKIVLEMLQQTFKPVTMVLIKNNLEYIKQFGSHVTSFNINNELNRFANILQLKKSKMIEEIEKLIIECEELLNHTLKINNIIQKYI